MEDIIRANVVVLEYEDNVVERLWIEHKIMKFKVLYQSQQYFN